MLLNAAKAELYYFVYHLFVIRLEISIILRTKLWDMVMVNFCFTNNKLYKIFIKRYVLNYKNYMLNKKKRRYFPLIFFSLKPNTVQFDFIPSYPPSGLVNCPDHLLSNIFPPLSTNELPDGVFDCTMSKWGFSCCLFFS